MIWKGTFENERGHLGVSRGCYSKLVSVRDPLAYAAETGAVAFCYHNHNPGYTPLARYEVRGSIFEEHLDGVADFVQDFYAGTECKVVDGQLVFTPDGSGTYGLTWTHGCRGKVLKRESSGLLTEFIFFYSGVTSEERSIQGNAWAAAAGQEEPTPPSGVQSVSGYASSLDPSYGTYELEVRDTYDIDTPLRITLTHDGSIHAIEVEDGRGGVIEDSWAEGSGGGGGLTWQTLQGHFVTDAAGHHIVTFLMREPFTYGPYHYVIRFSVQASGDEQWVSCGGLIYNPGDGLIGHADQVITFGYGDTIVKPSSGLLFRIGDTTCEAELHSIINLPEAPPLANYTPGIVTLHIAKVEL